MKENIQLLTIDSREIKGMIIEQNEPFYDKLLDNLAEMNKFLEKHNPTKAKSCRHKKSEQTLNLEGE